MIEIPSIGRRLFERKDAPAGPVPLVRILFPMFGEGSREGFQERRRRVVETVPECEPHRELPSIAQVQLAGEGDISIRGHVELPLHPIAGGQVRPSVALTYVAAGQARKGTVAARASQIPSFSAVKIFLPAISSTVGRSPTPPSRGGAHKA